MTPNPLKTALVLLPDPVRRIALCAVLRKSGYARVLEADTATEAITTLGAERVNLVLTVWEVADAEGPALLAALRDRGVNRNLPVVVLDTGLPQRSVVMAIKAGAAGKLALPTNPKALEEVLTRHRDGRTAPESIPAPLAKRRSQ
ncbi:MAG: response regulator [Deltaproteobacteria bacterium]|nr:response regulator [Deltaproteobacteria bacterium]